MNDIYREQLMEHYKHPSNMGKITDPTIEITEDNPMCGDVISIQLKINNEKIEDIKFKADACAVSTAAASILTEEVLGKSIEEVKNIKKEDILELLGVQLTTSRVQCAELPLKALKGMLEAYE